jgi:hypothetical protein
MAYARKGRALFPLCALLREDGTRDSFASRLGPILFASLVRDLGEVLPWLADIFARASRLRGVATGCHWGNFRSHAERTARQSQLSERLEAKALRAS